MKVRRDLSDKFLIVTETPDNGKTVSVWQTRPTLEEARAFIKESAAFLRREAGLKIQVSEDVTRWWTDARTARVFIRASIIERDEFHGDFNVPWSGLTV